MDIFGFSADMLPKLSVLFSGYHVTDIAKNRQQFRASLKQIFALKILRMFDVRRVRFRHCMRQQLDAEILQRQIVFAAALAEVLVRCASTAQKICNDFAHFLTENFNTQSRR